MTGLLFAFAASLALWVAGPAFEAQATVARAGEGGNGTDGPIAPESRDALAIAVMERLGDRGAFLREPSVMERLTAITNGAPSDASPETVRRRFDDRVSLEAGEDGTVVIFARGDDPQSALMLADAVSVTLRGREMSAPGQVRELPQPFLPVALVAGLVGVVAGASASMVGRPNAQRRGSAALGEPESGPPDEDVGEAELERSEDARPSAPPAGEAVSLDEVAAALEIEPVSQILFAHGPADDSVGWELARRLARSGASVLILDFSDPSPDPHADDLSSERVERVPVALPPSELPDDDREILAQAGEAYDHVVVDCGDLDAGEIALLADEDSAVLLAGEIYGAAREAEFRGAGLATLVLTN